jgi:flavin reductase (DIM6/NTAB) family NADH-FMN oxidoreductase RutF
MDERLFRDAMGKFATGITVVSLQDEATPIGMTVNAFMSISLKPKLIAISIDEAASMYDKLNETEKFGVSILSDKQKEYSMIYARQKQQVEEIPFTELDGVPVIKDAIVTLACKVDKKVRAGDHLIYIAEVTDLTVQDEEPTIFFGGKYRELIK